MSDFKAYLKQYVKHFSVGFIIVLVLAVIYLITKQPIDTSDPHYVSPNTERVYGDQRVFDYADQLTDEQEKELESYIKEVEYETCMDIVIVTLNQSLADYEPEYRSKYTVTITPDKYVMVYADKFWEDNKFGYDEPQVLDGTTRTGDGIILVDNVFREPETNKIYTWMGTTGKAEDHYSSYKIDYALDRFYDYVETDYYEACMAWIRDAKYEMSVTNSMINLSLYDYARLPILIGIVVALIYYCVNRKEKLGKVTTDAKTYIVNKSVTFPVRIDKLDHKSVTKVYNPPSSSSGSSHSGGGGHHSSGGGGSHGGGGHSR